MTRHCEGVYTCSTVEDLVLHRTVSVGASFSKFQVEISQ